MEKYFLGLDMGTSTVGWAATNTKYMLLRKKGKDLWGVREFDEAQTAADRRVNRISRRRRQREIVRIGLLKDYFSDAVLSVDPGFFIRLENSKYHLEDKDDMVKTKYALFADEKYSDIEYYKEYPTIFHLRHELITNPEEHDVRLVFLALLNMFKHRGHFLNSGSVSEDSVKIDEAYNYMREQLENQFEICLPEVEGKKVEDILSSKEKTRSEKAELLSELLSVSKSQKRELLIIKTICGLKGDVKAMFGMEELEEKVEIQFSAYGYDDKEAEIHAAIGDEAFEVITAIKAVYDIGSLSGILRGYDYLSEARIADYEKHKHDLKILKKVIKTHSSQDSYDMMFRSEANGSYSAYVGSVSYDKLYESGEISKRRRNMKGRTRDDFYAAVKKILPKDSEDENVLYILKEIELETFMPKQLTASNGVIPNQIHEKEMRAILKNAKKYLPFLNETDESGLTVAERIIKLFTFQIPYYVGPTSDRSQADGGNGWVIRKEPGTVLPWNIEEKIDLKKTSEKFINRMVRKCTYICDETVLPKSSLMYESYCVLNEINNIKIDEERISIELKQEIYNELFKKGKKVTRKKLADYLIKKGLITNDNQISGIDININNSLGSYGKFRAIFGDEIDTDDGEKKIEDIIFWCTIFGDSKAFLKENIKEHYPEVTDEQIKRICGIKFKDWGRFSKEFLLLQGCDKSTGEIMSLKRALWETEYNLMELLNSDLFTFKEALKEKQKKSMATLTDFTPDMLEEYYFSPPVKKMIWQTISIIKELTYVLGQPPEKIFIEMTRTDEEKGDSGRKDSRKKKLLEAYKGVKDDLHNWKELIEESDKNGKLRSKKMFLYLSQMGRDMYTGKPIELSKLFDDNLYDIDHIYPRHYVKDDSIHNNLVLVNKQSNAHKSDEYPLNSSIRNTRNVRELWETLRTKNLITEEKYRRLTGTKEFSEEQRADFIARQLVETGQATKGVADLLKAMLPDSQIVYAKASNVSDFRRKYDRIKSRSVNDFHHAHDAYLNIVVGNVYLTKFTNNPINFIRKEYMADREKNNYHMYAVFNKDVVRNGVIAWKAPRDGDAGTIETVKKMLDRNTPMITRQSFTGHGGIADQTLYGHRKAKDVGYIPLKSSDEHMLDVKKYGGFSKASTAYFFLVEHEVKGKRVRTIEALPVYMKEKVEKNPGKLEQYCRDVLNLKDISIRMRKIKLQSLIRLNGFYLIISGKTGDRLFLRNAVSLCLENRWIKYIKKLEKSMESDYSEEILTKEKNLGLYDILADKYCSGIFSKRPNYVGDKLVNGRDTFETLDMSDQIKVLTEIIKLSTLGPTLADLTSIGAASKTGNLTISKNISNVNEILLISQSPTGLFEKRIDLLTV